MNKFNKNIHKWRGSKWNCQIMGETEPWLTICCHQVKLLVLGLGYISFSYLQKGPIGITKQPRLLANYRLFSKIWLKYLLINVKSIQFITHGEVKLMPIYNVHPYPSVLISGRCSACSQNRNAHTNPTKAQSLWSTVVCSL